MRTHSGRALSAATFFVAATVLVAALCSGCRQYKFWYVIVNKGNVPIEVSYNAVRFAAPNGYESGIFHSAPLLNGTKGFEAIDEYVAFPPDQITVSGTRLTVTLPARKALLVANALSGGGSQEYPIEELNLNITTPYGVCSFTGAEVLGAFGEGEPGVNALFLLPWDMAGPLPGDES